MSVSLPVCQSVVCLLCVCCASVSSLLSLFLSSFSCLFVVCLSLYLAANVLFTCLVDRMSVCWPVCLSACLSASPSAFLLPFTSFSMSLLGLPFYFPLSPYEILRIPKMSFHQKSSEPKSLSHLQKVSKKKLS
jgi:hypothetical protein